ncbi:uncharacterized protein LOC118336301 [Morone saxatilis]|uniref:uncharacterized protein LOC118336301 n=1 Tax=Morone saxatilis TaxID=34816 RepID=UPI0015E20779|nr:uncharacterized protein LOC118336301 [Morone saxatilis]
MLAKESVATNGCSQCGNNCAAIRCRDCLPCHFLCAECDISRHSNASVLHNRDAMFAGFFEPLPPTTCVVEKALTNCVRFLPIEMPVSICGCPPEALRVIKGKAVALVTINGRYDLNMPELTCEGCQATWTAGLDDLINSGYWPATLHFVTIYETDLFYTFEDMKMASPGMSFQAYLRMLEKRTARFGRISSDSFQKSFFEWASVQSEVDSTCKEEKFICPACTPAMLAVSVDGNRKHYRFKSTARSQERAIFDGVFIAKDEDVTRFVDHIHSKNKHVAGRSNCGGEWSAARETSQRSSSKVDETGLELAVCRHGVLLAALNMFRGEIFAYPMFLQQLLASKHDVTFFCMDVVCKYWPYLQRISTNCPELQPLQNMRPFLSVVHAKAHDFKCEVKWSGTNQEGAGKTLGEEVEQCNAFLSRIAVTTKHMSKAGRNDMLTLLAIRCNQQKCQNLATGLSQRYHKTSKALNIQMGDLETLKAQHQLDEQTVEEFVQEVKEWADGETDHQGTPQALCKKIEDLTSSIKTRAQLLYRKNDSNKGRHRIRRKIKQQKTTLKAMVAEYNSLVPHEQAVCMDSILDTEHPWPWQITQSGSADFSTKKEVFDRVMGVRRLQEEKKILVKEMKQHWESLKAHARVLSELSQHQSEDTIQRHLTEKATKGHTCLILRKQWEMRELQRHIRKHYLHVLSSADDIMDTIDSSDEFDISSEDSESDAM